MILRGSSASAARALKHGVCSLALTILTLLSNSLAPAAAADADFNIWVGSDPHVTVDTLHGVEPMRLAFRQSEGFWSFLPKYEVKAGGIPPAFDWDLMLLAGDLTSSQFPPRDGEGRIFVDQFEALRHHRREDVFTLAGNHDGSYYDEGVGSWYQKWADPMGENTEYSGVNMAERRFKPQGTWERYKIEAGNVLILMLSDQNSAPTPVGRGNSKDGLPGGFPAGAVTRETFNWWKEQVLGNQDKIIITAHHHVLRDTTTISTPYGGKGIHANNTGDFEAEATVSDVARLANPANDPNFTVYTVDLPVYAVGLIQQAVNQGKSEIQFRLAFEQATDGTSTDDYFGFYPSETLVPAYSPKMKVDYAN